LVILQDPVLIRRLLIRPGAIGDFILSLPALETLRADHTEIWCAESNIPLAFCADQARSIVSAGLDRLGLLPAEDVVERLRGFDSIVSWYGSNRPEFRELVGSLGLSFTFLPALPKGGPAHAVEFYNAQAFEVIGRRGRRFPRIPVPPAERRFAAIHPFASSVAKRAPFSLFRQIADRLSEQMPVRWLRGPEEELPADIQIEFIADLYELAKFLSRARIYVGNDSGVTHLAAAVGTPAIAFFRTTDPRVWGPRGVSVDVVKMGSNGGWR
jgi:ADP-heptose:LPS heptosyltransferase